MTALVMALCGKGTQRHINEEGKKDSLEITVVYFGVA